MDEYLAPRTTDAQPRLRLGPELGDFLDATTVAQILGRKKSRVYEMIAAGIIPSLRLGPRRVVVPRAAWAAVIAASAARAIAAQAAMRGEV